MSYMYRTVISKLKQVVQLSLHGIHAPNAILVIFFAPKNLTLISNSQGSFPTLKPLFYVTNSLICSIVFIATQITLCVLPNSTLSLKFSIQKYN